MNLFKVTFEHVSAIQHPEYYNGDNPAVRPDQVPEVHWSTADREGDEASIRSQYEGLQRLMAQGELIRNVAMLTGETTPVAWRQVNP